MTRIDTAEQAHEAYYASGDNLNAPAHGETEYDEEVGGWVLQNIHGVLAVVLEDGTVVDPEYDDEEGWVAPRRLRGRRAEEARAELERTALLLDGAAASAEIAAEVLRRHETPGLEADVLDAARADLRRVAETVQELVEDER